MYLQPVLGSSFATGKYRPAALNVYIKVQYKLAHKILKYNNLTEHKHKRQNAAP